MIEPVTPDQIPGMVKGLLALDEGLDDFQLEFIESINNQLKRGKRPKDLTTKQVLFLTKLYDEKC